MKMRLVLLSVLIVTALVGSACAPGGPTATPAPTPVPTRVPTPVATPEATPVPTTTAPVPGGQGVGVTCDEFEAQGNVSRAVEGEVGDVFTVTLCSNRTTGFSWSRTAQIADPAILQQTSHEYQAPTGEVVGAPGTEVWTFEALKNGVTTVSMAYSRQWPDGEQGVWNFTLTVTVGHPLTVSVTCDEFEAQGNVTRAVQAEVGDTFKVTLCSNATTGFRWGETARIADPAKLQQTGHEYQAPTGGLVGAPGTETWTFKSLKSGVTTVSMAYSRQWPGGEQGVWNFTLNVTVGQPLTAAVTCDEFEAQRNVTETVRGKVGDTFTVTLCSNRTTGFSWSRTAQIADATVLQQTSHEYQAPTGGVVGAPGSEVWTFDALKNGVTTVSMAYSREWPGGEQGVWNFTLTVTVD